MGCVKEYNEKEPAWVRVVTICIVLIIVLTTAVSALNHTKERKQQNEQSEINEIEYCIARGGTGKLERVCGWSCIYYCEMPDGSLKQVARPRRN
jgi:putative hemolysin